MQARELLEIICSKEIQFNLYNIKIDDISIYNYIQRLVRQKIFDYYGFGLNYDHPPVKDREPKKSLRKSFWQITKLIICRKKYNNVFRAFERTDIINGLYVDKFTDPLIDYSSIGHDYIIFDNGRKGKHNVPRIHADKVIYTGFIYWLAWKLLPFKIKKFNKRHFHKIDLLEKQIKKAFPEINISKEQLLKSVTRQSIITSIYRYIFRCIGANKMFAPARGSFKHIIPAAKLQNIIVYELQHGITYGNSITYEGYIDYFFSPDYFLSFGRIESASNYGITDDKIIDIGLAFEYYFKANVSNINSKDILLISAPNITDKMILIDETLAQLNPIFIFAHIL